MPAEKFLIYLIVRIAVGCLFGMLTKHINESKGHFGGFAWGFWLHWIGVVVVACKEPAYRPVRESVIRPLEEEIAPPNTWKCRCGRYNAMYVSTCACGLGKNQEELPESTSSVPEEEAKNIALLKEYKALLDSGVITQKEFEEKKKSILS